MSLDDDIRIIASAQLFDALQPEQLRLLAFGAERLSFKEGRTLYREGDHADYGFVLASGEIELTKIIDGKQRVLQTVTPGMVLGELAMITQTERLTNAVAKSDCEMVRINRSLFLRMLSEYPETAAAIHNDLSERLKQFLKKIANLDQKFANSPDL